MLENSFTYTKEGWPETTCPDLGDCSEVPHDDLDGQTYPWFNVCPLGCGATEGHIPYDLCWNVEESTSMSLFDIDRARLMMNTED